MSPLVDLRGDAISQPNIDVENQQIFQTSAGLWPLIFVGSLWQNGRCLHRPAGKECDFLNLVINQEMVREIRANHEIDGRSLIPSTHHVIGKGSGKGTAFQSRCLCIQHDGDPCGIIIPAMEIIRFYYATSTRMAQAMVNHDFQLNLNALVNPDECDFNPETRSAHVTLRKEIKDLEAWTIARILNSTAAARGTRMIGDSLMRESYERNRPLHPAVIFPFVGETNLRVRGKWIPRAEKPDGWRFLVFSITGCSGPFPYSEIIRDRDNPNTKANPDTDIAEEEKKNAFLSACAPSAAEIAGGEIQSGAEPFAGIDETYLSLEEDRFDALRGNELITLVPEKNRYKSGGWKPTYAIETSVFGTGQGSTVSSDIAPIRIVIEQPEESNVTANVFDFIAIVGEMNLIDGFTASMRKATDPIRFVPLTKASRKAQWSYLVSNERIRRRVFVADVVLHGRVFTLVDFEWRDGQPYKLAIFRSLDCNRVSDDHLKELLVKMAMKEGVWDKITQPEFIQRETRKHTWKENAKDAAVKISEKLFEMLTSLNRVDGT